MPSCPRPGADRARRRNLPLGLSLRDHGPSGAAGQRPADPYSRAKILELLERPEIDIRLTSARIDRTELLKWFENKKIEILNGGRTAPARAPNTDLFPRDEYYLNRP